MYRRTPYPAFSAIRKLDGRQADKYKSKTVKYNIVAKRMLRYAKKRLYSVKEVSLSKRGKFVVK